MGRSIPQSSGEDVTENEGRTSVPEGHNVEGTSTRSNVVVQRRFRFYLSWGSGWIPEQFSDEDRVRS